MDKRRVALLALSLCMALMIFVLPGTVRAVSSGLEVRHMALQPDGKILIGEFVHNTSGRGRAVMVRLYADGSLDKSFDPNVNGPVFSMALQPDGKILIGGGIFGAAGALTENYITRLNADGTLDTSFNSGVDLAFATIALQPDRKIFIGGNTKVGVTEPVRHDHSIDTQKPYTSATRNSIARINADGSLDKSFNSDVDGTVASIALQRDGKVLIGGSFRGVGGVARNHIARLNADGSLDKSFDPDVEGASVVSMALQPDGKVLIAGFVSGVGGVARSRIARLNEDGSLDRSFDPNVNELQRVPRPPSTRTGK